jgi:hypothetical protein
MLVLQPRFAIGALLLSGGALLVQEPGIARGGGGGNSKAPSTTPSIAAQQQYWFGIAVQNLPPAISRQLKLRPDQGLMVLEVLPDSPASRAELRPEDLLLEIDGVALTSYEELVRAANRGKPRTESAVAEAAEGKLTAALLPGSCRLTILRGGDRKTVTIVPTVRPSNLQAIGANLGNFTVGGANRQAGRGGGGVPRMVVLSNGTTAQVGPGYAIDLNGPEASTVSMRRIVARGETVTFTQELDGGGATRHRLSVGNKSYIVEPGKVEALPEEVQPLARLMLANLPPPAAAPPLEPAPAPVPLALTPSAVNREAGGEHLEKRIEELEKQNAALRDQNEATQQRLERVIELLEDRARKRD